MVLLCRGYVLAATPVSGFLTFAIETYNFLDVVLLDMAL